MSTPLFFIKTSRSGERWYVGGSSAAMSVGLPSVCLSVPAVQEQKVCTASVDRQTHHNTHPVVPARSDVMGRGKGTAQEVISDEGETHGGFFFLLLLLFRHFKKKKVRICLGENLKQADYVARK